MESVKLEAKCISCGHKWTMTTAEVALAEAEGIATCPKCHSPAVVEKAST